MSVVPVTLNPRQFVRDACFPFSIQIDNIGLLSESDKGIVLARKKYNRVKKMLTLHYSSLTKNEFELLAYFYEYECSNGLHCFYWRYPVLNNADPSDVGYMFQGKLFYVYISKFSFKAVNYNNYQGDIVLNEM